MIYHEKTAREIARLLLEKEAVILRPEEPFTWASGWKSPIYCDNRLLLSYPDVRTFVKVKLSGIVKEKFASARAIVGVATAGISHAALLADQLNLPMAYARTNSKGHGRKNLVEGKIEDGLKTVVVEDLISTGMSSFGVVEKLREMHVRVAGLIAIFSYDFARARDYASQIGLEYYTLSDYNVLVEEALSSGYISEGQVDMLTEWRRNPENWGR